jgi:GNAT superfamily N-acetyltransferase
MSASNETFQRPHSAHLRWDLHCQRRGRCHLHWRQTAQSIRRGNAWKAHRVTGRGTGNEVAVGRLENGERADALVSLARAFWPDPLVRFFTQGPLHEYRALPRFFAPLFDDAWSHGEIWGARTSQRCIGTACWLGPTAIPRGRRRDAVMYSRLAPQFVTARNRGLGMRLLTEVERRHPHEPHWYLALLGVDPGWQRRGIGGSLLAPVLERCDRDVMPAYLETQRPENVAFYRTVGFDVHEQIRLPGAPPVWLLWREPQAGEPPPSR